MAKFKVGDRVVRIKPSDTPDLWGVEGYGYTVLSVALGGSIGVIFEDQYASSDCFEIATLKVGDTVRLKARLSYKYGRGRATADDVGKIVEVRAGGGFYVDFPNHRRWASGYDEVEFVRRKGVKPFFKLQRVSFPQCCTARVLHSFGGTSTAIFKPEIPQESIEEALEEQIEWGKECGIAMLTCTTNDQQKAANKALLAKGFKHSNWMDKPTHSYTKVRLWWYPLFA